MKTSECGAWQGTCVGADCQAGYRAQPISRNNRGVIAPFSPSLPTTATMAPLRRGPWSQTEDSILMQLIHFYEGLNWVRISILLGSRSPKQCRDRYHQSLKPSLSP